MSGRNSIRLVLAIALMAAVLTLYLHFRSQPAVHPDTGGAEPTVSLPQSPVPPIHHEVKSPAEGVQTNKVFLLHSRQVLATVNGTSITLRDLIPLNPPDSQAEQQLAPEAYEYFLQRAINRELILQTARAQRVTLSEGQEQQLAKMRTEREASEPGLVSKKTVDAAQVEFELRDTEAFMLQTSIMQQAGSTPNVTPDQVEQYYQQHVSEFGKLPADPQTRQEVWQKIDFQIRDLLASQTRSQYNKQLQEYMVQLRAKAQVVITPLSESQADAISPETASTSR